MLRLCNSHDAAASSAECHAKLAKPRMMADLVTNALTIAWFRWRPGPGLMHHSDRSSQYVSSVFPSKLADLGRLQFLI